MASAPRFINAGMLLFSLLLAACGGSGTTTTTASPVVPHGAGDAGRSPQTSGTSTISLPPLSQGYSGTLTIGFITGRGNQLRVEIAPTDTTNGNTVPPPCPTIPVIQLENISSTPVTLTIQGISLNVPCNVAGQQFGATFFTLLPPPTVVRSTKLGDGMGAGTQIQISSSQQVTLPPMTTSSIVVLSDPSGAEVALPVAPGSTSVLTSSKSSNIPTDLSFFYTSGQGASLFTTSCFDASLLPATLPRVGRPSFFCHLNPGNANVSFGTLVKFFIGVPKIDGSILGLDGPNTNFACNNAVTSTECDTPAFTVSNTSSTAFQNVIVGNVDDLRACVPKNPASNCTSLTSPGPSTTTVSSHNNFTVLVADDATYRPGAGPWDGLFHDAIASGSCVLAGSSTVPGPSGQFAVTPTGSGTCVITVTEDAAFIVADFSNPAVPKGRSVQLSITMH